MSRVKTVSYSTPASHDAGATPDDIIAYTARVSNPGNQRNHETAPRLLKYLARNEHWSPFEMANLCLQIDTTRDIARQILRHRSFSFQEFSQRYADVDALGAEFIRRECRMQDTANRQNSVECADPFLKLAWDNSSADVYRTAIHAYNAALDRGIAKEVARALLPEGLTPSRIYMNGTVRSWMHYIKVRTAPGTQKEHRQIAEECKARLLEVYPSIEEFFNEN